MRHVLVQVYAVLAIVLYVFVFHHNPASAQEYTVKGFDLSHHQGDIQWKKISPQQYRFIYLKATEGGDFKDRKFQDNWLQARRKWLFSRCLSFLPSVSGWCGTGAELH